MKTRLFLFLAVVGVTLSFTACKSTEEDVSTNTNVAPDPLGTNVSHMFENGINPQPPRVMTQGAP